MAGETATPLPALDRPEGGSLPEFHPGTSYIPALDGIRAVAALQVLFLHFTTLNGVPVLLRKLALMGQGGVDLFFVLSGFLITRILLASSRSQGYFSHFYIRRALRILPLYYAFLVLFFFIRPLLFGTPQAPFAHQIWSWLFLENVPLTFTGLATEGPNHYWSLAVEEHFYLLWPLLVFWLSRERLRTMLWFFIAGAPLVRAVLVWQHIGVGYFTLCRIDGLALGALLACWYDKSSLGSPALVLGGRISMVVLALALIPMFGWYSGSHAGWLQVAKLSFMPAFFFSVMLLCLIDPRAGLLRGFFSFPVLRWLGKISYGLYVLHPLVMMGVDRLPAVQNNLFVAALAFFGGTVLLAYASYRFFESPILRCKDRFRYAIGGSANTAG